jgi:hypothetical protein
MTTVIRRSFRATPFRDAHATWVTIVDLLTRGRDGNARRQLMAVSGTAASVIADQAPRDEPIIVTCNGPRTRIYCMFDDDALDGSDASEEPVGFDPLNGDWQVSLPCPEEDLAWVQGALARHGARITARGPGKAPAADGREAASVAETLGPLVIDPKGFLGQ